MKCPRCNSKVPDNMKFCGFCGIELETGNEEVIHLWNDYFNSQLAYCSDRMTGLDAKTIASMGLLFGSVITLVANSALESPQSLALVVLSSFGIVGGFFLSRFFLIRKLELNIVVMISGDAHWNILKGELKTSNEIVSYLGGLFRKYQSRIKRSLRAWYSIRGEEPEEMVQQPFELPRWGS